MPGAGAPARVERRRANPPIRGDYRSTPRQGWQHSKYIPKPPPGLMPATETAWKTWFASFFAAHWTPEDLPGLRIVALIYDQVERGELRYANELRIQMDGYGMTPKGQQDRRWIRAEPEEDPEVVRHIRRFGKLQAADE